MECHATGSLVPALRGGGGGVGVPGSSVSLSMSSLPGTFPPTGIKPFLPYMSQAGYLGQDHRAEPVGSSRAAVVLTRPVAKALRPPRRDDLHGFVDVVHGHAAHALHPLGHTIRVQVDVHRFGNVRFAQEVMRSMMQRPPSKNRYKSPSGASSSAP